MKIPTQIQLGLQQDTRWCHHEDVKKEGPQPQKQLIPGEYPLAYCRRYDTSADSKKFTDNISAWVKGCGLMSGEFKPIVLDNIPIEGFTFGEAISRYSTSNKFFEVNDPRGFKLQIPAANLALLISSATIEAGVLKSKCVWGFDGSNVLLLDTNSPYYIESIAEIKKKAVAKEAEIKLTKDNLVLGGIYLNSQNKQVMYIGKGHLHISCIDRSAGWRDKGYTYKVRKQERLSYIFLEKKGLTSTRGVARYTTECMHLIPTNIPAPGFDLQNFGMTFLEMRNYAQSYFNSWYSDKRSNYVFIDFKHVDDDNYRADHIDHIEYIDE